MALVGIKYIYFIRFRSDDAGFPQRLKNLENEDGYEKVMEQGKLAKRYGILLSVMEFYQSCLQFVPHLYVFFATAKTLSINVDSPHFPMFSAKRRECKMEKRGGHGKLRNGNVM